MSRFLLLNYTLSSRMDCNISINQLVMIVIVYSWCNNLLDKSKLVSLILIFFGDVIFI